MNNDNRAKSHTILPGSAEEAAELFSSLSSERKAGRDAKVRLVDSPFEAIDEDTGHTDLSSVSSAGMDRIREISKPDLLAVCGGGVKLSDLRAEVEKESLFFPFDPELAAGDATLSEIVMGGAVSRYEGKYGRLREYILSLEIVTGDGRIIRTGTRSVKNVAGYELTALAVGGGSRCGLITSLTLRLLPAPEMTSVVAVPGNHHKLAAEEVARHLKPDTASVELIRGRTIEALLGTEAPGMGVPEGPGRALLLVESHGKDFGGSNTLLDLRRALVDRIGKVNRVSFMAMDLKGPLAADPPVTDGWFSVNPGRSVVLGASEDDTASDNSRGLRIAAGSFGPVGEQPFLRRLRTPIADSCRELADISGRIDRVFDPESLIVKD